MTVLAFEGLKTQTAGEIKTPHDIVVERVEWNPGSALVYEASRHLNLYSPINQGSEKPDTLFDKRVPVAYVSLDPAEYDEPNLRIRHVWTHSLHPGYSHLSDREKRLKTRKDVVDSLDGVLTDLSDNFDNLESVRLDIPQRGTLAGVAFNTRFTGWRRRFMLDGKGYVRPDHAKRLFKEGRQISVEYEPLTPQHEVLAAGEVATKQAAKVPAQTVTEESPELKAA